MLLNVAQFQGKMINFPLKYEAWFNYNFLSLQVVEEDKTNNTNDQSKFFF